MGNFKSILCIFPRESQKFLLMTVKFQHQGDKIPDPIGQFLANITLSNEKSVLFCF